LRVRARRFGLKAGETVGYEVNAAAHGHDDCDMGHLRSAPDILLGRLISNTEDGHPNTQLLATRNVVMLTQLSTTRRTRMVIVTTFSSREAMEQVLEMGLQT
jgi:hypothetical protein